MIKTPNNMSQIKLHEPINENKKYEVKQCLFMHPVITAMNYKYDLKKNEDKIEIRLDNHSLR